ncbi:hypothetical protein [Bacillus solitudinis]|uniref:hypothetical protein n=1 Tax=Bacillus solitudinis TaxID=2014074 RepID=UPI000C251266|nr:hypothetical protein [Bacillus solitudinis]
MTKQDILDELKKRDMKDILEIVKDAEKGYLEELELVESIGLVYDKELNDDILSLLKEFGVKIEYVKDEEE